MVEGSIHIHLGTIELPEGENKQDQTAVDLHEQLRQWFHDLDQEGIDVEDGHLRVDLVTEEHRTAAADYI